MTARSVLQCQAPHTTRFVSASATAPRQATLKQRTCFRGACDGTLLPHAAAPRTAALHCLPVHGLRP